MLLPLQDALTKLLILHLPIWEVVLVRSATILVICLATGRSALVKASLATPRRGELLLRAIVMLGGWLTFYVAVQALPLGQAITIYFVSPVLVSLMAGPVLGERLLPVHWAAVLLGFAGVAVTSGLVRFEFSFSVALAIGSAFLWAVSLLLLRRLSAKVGTSVQVVWVNGTFVLATACAGLVWPIVGRPVDLLWMAGVGLVGGAGQYAFYEAARWVPAAVLATLEYLSIVSAFALGFLIFGEVPTVPVVVGAAIVLASGVLVVVAERMRSAATPATVP